MAILLAQFWIAPSRKAVRPEIPTSIRDLIAHPDTYDGHRVRVAGRLDECAGWECSLCPADMTTATRDYRQCLPLGFRPLIPGTGFGAAEQESVFRFSDVALTATFDPGCWKVPCVDRRTVLRDAAVIAISKWRASRTGLWLGERTPLAEVSGSTARTILAGAQDAGFPDTAPRKVYRTIGETPVFLVCWTSLEFEAGSWPDTLEGALDAVSKGDFYRCHKVRNRSGRWIFQIEG